MALVSSKTINWSEQAQGNKMLQRLHPGMLTPEGYKVQKELYLHGSRRDSQKAIVDVVYDESYVIEKLVREVLIPLNPNGYNDFQKIISKAWKKFEGERKGWDDTDS